MAIAFVAAGAVTNSQLAITPALPAGIATDDILLLYLESANEAITVADAAGGTWTELPDSPQSQGTAGGAGGLRITVFWSRYNGTQTAPTTSDSGNHQTGVILAYSGCITTGDPFDVTAGDFIAATTAGSIPGDTTTVDGCMIVAASALDRDLASTTNASAWTNASLVSIDERADQTFSAAAGGGLVAADGIKTTAGAVSATTWTSAASTAQCNHMVALKPATTGVTGTVAVTQADQTSTASGTVANPVTGTVAVTQAAQTSAASGTETFTATSAASQDAQTSTASGTVANPVTGNVAVTQAAQTSTATGAESFTGTAAATQADQTSTASAVETITGTSATTQANQTSTASGVVGDAASGTLAETQDDQTSTASGTVVVVITGSAAITQAAQTSTGTAVETFTGTSANVQADQGAVAVGVLGFSGTSTVTQADQTSIASGTALFAVTGTVAVVQADQFSTATGTGGILTFWSLNPVVYTKNPVSHVKAPVAFVKVGPGDDPPW